MSRPAATCGAIWPRTARPTTTSANSSRQSSAMRRSQRIRRRGRCCAGGSARARPSRRASRLPAEWGGGVNKWPWPIPLIASNTATKPELVGHFAPEAPDFNLACSGSDSRGDFSAASEGVGGRQAAGQGHDAEFHSCCGCRTITPHGTTPGKPTPKASVSRITIWRWAARWMRFRIRRSGMTRRSSFSKTMRRMAADHVDAHRSIALVISKYAPHGQGWRAGCRQPILFDGERYPHDGDAAGSAADE